jgi:hypothetical protein
MPPIDHLYHRLLPIGYTSIESTADFVSSNEVGTIDPFPAASAASLRDNDQTSRYHWG